MEKRDMPPVRSETRSTMAGAAPRVTGNGARLAWLGLGAHARHVPATIRAHAANVGPQDP
jgi:hypothetical protein